VTNTLFSAKRVHFMTGADMSARLRDLMVDFLLGN
jgi:hypothetical protein